MNWTRPVRLECPICGESEVVDRDQVGQWIETHECPNEAKQ